MGISNLFKKKNPGIANSKEPLVQENNVGFKEKSRRIYPYVKVLEGGGENQVPFTALPPMTVEIQGKKVTVDLISFTFLGDLAVFFAYDPEGSSQITLVRKEDLLSELDENQLLAVAQENLLRDISFKLQPTNYGGFGIVAGGNYEASALICNGLLKQIGDTLKRDFVIALPARDMFLITGAEEKKKLISGL